MVAKDDSLDMERDEVVCAPGAKGTWVMFLMMGLSLRGCGIA